MLAQSEQLKLVERPLVIPLYGSTLVLGELQPHLVPDQLVAVSGKRQRIAFAADTDGRLVRRSRNAQAAARRIVPDANRRRRSS